MHCDPWGEVKRFRYQCVYRLIYLICPLERKRPRIPVLEGIFENYSSDYGAVGYAVAFAHLWACRFFSKVFVLSEPMKNQVSKVIGTEPVVHRNFVDEGFLENFRITESAAESLRIVFVGSLTSRKRPELLVDALAKLRSGGLEASVTFMGAGDREELINNAPWKRRCLIGSNFRLCR